MIEALGRLWHRDHFNCVKCNTALGANNIDFRPLGPYGDSPICVDCYMDMYHPKCAGCDLPLRETCVEAEQKQWHQSCFKCRRCNSPIGGAPHLAGSAFNILCYCQFQWTRTTCGKARSTTATAFTCESTVRSYSESRKARLLAHLRTR